jgi:hypothetical protein
VEEELDEEIRSYQAMLEDEGLSRREAALELGGAELVKEEVRDVRLGTTLGQVAAEVRQSLRGLRRNWSRRRWRRVICRGGGRCGSTRRWHCGLSDLHRSGPQIVKL